MLSSGTQKQSLVACRLSDGDDQTAGPSVVPQTMEELNERLTLWETQSWLVLAEDLCICLRPDGSDWQLGRGSYGSVSLSMSMRVSRLLMGLTGQMHFPFEHSGLSVPRARM